MNCASEGWIRNHNFNLTSSNNKKYLLHDYVSKNSNNKNYLSHDDGSEQENKLIYNNGSETDMIPEKGSFSSQTVAEILANNRVTAVLQDALEQQ